MATGSLDAGICKAITSRSYEKRFQTQTEVRIAVDSMNACIDLYQYEISGSSESKR